MTRFFVLRGYCIVWRGGQQIFDITRSKVYYVRIGGSRPHPIGKRTPRFPVSFSHVNSEKYFSPTKHGLKFSANAHDDEVAHEITVALAEASQRGGSSQVSGTLTKRDEGVLSLQPSSILK